MDFEQYSLEARCGAALQSNDNHVSDIERTQIKHRCVEMENQLSVLDIEIAQLVAKREAHAKSIATLRSAISPHRRLPTELLSRVFMHVIDSSGALDIVLHLSDMLPWGLGRVCSRWRSVLYGEPRLWKNVNFILGHPHYYEYFNRTPVKLSVCLRRVREILPRGLVCLKLWLFKYSRTVYDVKLTLGQLAHFRLKRLHLSLDLETLMELLRDIPQSFSSLEDVALDIICSVITEEVVEQLAASNLFVVASRVTELALGHVSGTNNRPQLLPVPHIPWSQIVCLSLDMIYSEYTHHDFLDIITQTPMLQDLTCQFDFFLDYNPLDQDSSLPSPRGYTLLPNINLPHLTRLKITTPSLIMAYLPFPWPQLRSLSFVSIIDIRIIKGILRHTPHLDFLCLKGGSFLNESIIWDPPIKLNSLSQVEIGWEMAQLLDHITAPQLDRLQVYASDVFPYVDSLPCSIGNFITRSSPSRFSLSYLTTNDWECRFVGRPNEYDPEEFLNPMTHCLHELRAYPGPLVFIDDIVTEIGCGSLFPKLQALEIRINSPIVFANAVERRMKTGLKEGFIRLKKAYGYYGTSITKDLVDVSNAIQKLKEFNECHGTDFRLIAIEPMKW